jgi:hypothetical protein
MITSRWYRREDKKGILNRLDCLEFLYILVPTQAKHFTSWYDACLPCRTYNQGLALASGFV